MDGFAANTLVATGRPCAAATSITDGSSARTVLISSTPAQSRSPATATGARRSQHLGTDGTRSPPHNPTGSWRAGCGGSCTSGSASGPGKRISRNADTAPRSDSTSTWRGRSPIQSCESRSDSPACRLTSSNRCSDSMSASTRLKSAAAGIEHSVAPYNSDLEMKLEIRLPE